MDGWEFWAGKPLPGTTRSCKNGLKNNQSHCLFVKSVELWRHLGNNFIFGIMHDTYGLQSIQYSFRLIWYEMSKFWIFIKINYVFRSSTFQSTRGPRDKLCAQINKLWAIYEWSTVTKIYDIFVHQDNLHFDKIRHVYLFIQPLKCCRFEVPLNAFLNDKDWKSINF